MCVCARPAAGDSGRFFFIENEIGGERTMMNDDFGIEGKMATVMAISLGVISWGVLLYLPFQTSVA